MDLFSKQAFGEIPDMRGEKKSYQNNTLES